jgi:hypothetical protein
MGMGVPIFCILFGFVVGWFLVRYVTATTVGMRRVLTKVLLYGAVTAAYTCLLMALIWGGSVSMLFDAGADFVNFGMPLILYEPKISFIGWLVLMIGISPFLQLLATVFGAYLTLLRWLRRDAGGQ